MKPRHFVLSVFVAFVFVLIGYGICVDTLVIPNRNIESSYQRFLLRAGNEINGKIIVDGGSSALHSIDPRLLEKRFGRFTVILADNAGYHLKHKLDYLEKYTVKDDIVILALEWSHYVYDAVRQDFVDNVVEREGALSFYYRNFSLFHQLDFIYHRLSFHLAAKHLINLTGVSHFNSKLRKSEEKNIKAFSKRIDRGERGEYFITQVTPPKLSSGKKYHCDDARMGYFQRIKGEDVVFTASFLNSLSRLQRLKQEQGVRVVFTWPAVVGYLEDTCYQSEYAKNNLEIIANKIRKAVVDHGLEFVAEYQDTNFDNSCFANTSYHILKHCAVTRTEMLANELERIGVASRPEYHPDNTAKLLRQSLNSSI